MGVIHELQEPKIWRNVPSCVVKCCESLISRCTQLENKHKDSDALINEVDRKLKVYYEDKVQ